MEEVALAYKQVIADARAVGNTTHFGFDGALLAQGERYTYQFTLHRPWDPEENSRIYVELVKGGPLEQQLAARVVSREETTLVFSTREPIPAHLLHKATLIEDRTWLLERQLEVVQRYLDGALVPAPGGYGAKLLHLRPVRYGRKRVRGALGSFRANAEQQRALEHGLGSQVTIIVGAAGTGKSAVQALLCTRFLQQGYSVLSLSHTNSATDNLFLDQVQFLEESGDADLLRLLREGRIVRAGDPRHISLLQGAYRHLTASAIAEARAHQVGTCRRLEEVQQALGKNIKDFGHRVQRVEGRWQGERAGLEQRKAELEAMLAPLEEPEPKRLAGITAQIASYLRCLETVLRHIEEGDAEVAAGRAELEQAQRKRKEIDSQLADLKTQLSTQKAQIVANAQLVTTTVTGASLNREILRRHYDVVVLDEISMIPLATALLAAMHATRYVIVAGDPTQLLPILKTGCQERERTRTMPEAVKWLSRDLLSHLGITIADAIGGRKGCVFLKEQGRMHPRILAPINHYVYQDMLVSRPETEYAPPIAPLPTCPLMLVDSSSSSRSKTSRGRDDQARVNPHHIEVVVALVPQILATLPERSAREDPTVPRIGVLAPYRSQVKRLLAALRVAGLAQDVHVGTINTAQALQFEVVILDTVEAPGYAPIAFTYDRVLDDRGAATEATRRLNVGHTRARYKLIYLAHLEQLCRYRPSNLDDQPQRRRLLADLAEWAAREGSISSWEVLHSSPDERNE